MVAGRSQEIFCMPLPYARLMPNSRSMAIGYKRLENKGDRYRAKPSEALRLPNNAKVGGWAFWHGWAPGDQMWVVAWRMERAERRNSLERSVARRISQSAAAPARVKEKPDLGLGYKASRLLGIPSLRILYCSVERLMPSREAAPLGPATVQWVSSRTPRISRRSLSSRPLRALRGSAICASPVIS